MKRRLFLLHRWLGLGACLLVLLWFVSGVVLMYVPFPALSEVERLGALAQIDATRVRAAPTVSPGTQRLRLIQPVDDPVYARLEPNGWQGESAVSGLPLEIDERSARRAAERFASASSCAVSLAAERIHRDQWSVSPALDPHRPLWAVTLSDGGRHYVSSRTGEVVRDTARSERAWNWVGAVVHWVYPTVLRAQPRLWHWVVVALSFYALVTALLGTVVGLWRWRRYANGRRTPYRGWMRWHHLLGLGGALFVLAWLFSGLLSMNPFEVFSSRRIPAAWTQAWQGPMTAPGRVAIQGAKELEWLPDRDGLLTVTRSSQGPLRLQHDGRDVSIDEHFMRQRAPALGLGPPLAIELLTEPDVYLTGRGSSGALPVWRLRFGDAEATWVHVDSRIGQPMARLDSSLRASRWLYHGLHSWDFDALLQRRPLWDVLMLTAMALGTALAFTSVVIAWRRLFPTRRRPVVERPPIPSLFRSLP